MLVMNRIIRGSGREHFFRGLGKIYAIDHVFSQAHLGVRRKTLIDQDAISKKEN